MWEGSGLGLEQADFSTASFEAALGGSALMGVVRGPSDKDASL